MKVRGPGAARVWVWVRAAVLTVFAALAVVVQFRIAQRGEASWPESFALGVAAVGFLVLTWTRWKVVGTLVVLASYVASVALPGSINNGLWFLLLPLLVDANSRRPRWLGLAFAVVLAVSAAWDMRGETGSVIGLLAYTSLLSMLGMFIRNRMENQRQLERLYRLERQAENQRLGALMHDAVASTLTQALAVTRDVLASTELPATQARRLDLVSENLTTALEELRAIMLVLGGTADATAGAASRTLGEKLALAQETLSAAGFTATVRATGQWSSVTHPGETVRLLLREAVANVTSHALSGGFVHISADVTNGQLQLAVLNQLPIAAGMGGAGREGQGLRNLQRRVLHEEGTFEAGASEGVWTLRATVPLEEVAHG